MPTLSIITAVSDASLPYLDETAASIWALEMPNGWDWQWCIQRDSAHQDLHTRRWADDARVSLGHNDAQRGASASRNQALVRAVGDLILAVDADDVVNPDAFAVLAAPLLADGCVGWSAGAWLELPLDESRRFRFVPADPGPKPAGWLNATIRELGTTPFAMNSILYRRRAVLATGGWPAFGEWEDTIMAVVVSNSWPGFVTDAVVGRYRRHPGQTTAGPRFKDVAIRETMIGYVSQLDGIQP